MFANLARPTAAALLAAAVLLCACSKREEGDSADAGADVTRQSYTVRGQVVTVPSQERPIDDLQIRHEAIPNYADREGKVVVNSKGDRGMRSMTMSFPVAEGLSLEGIAPGDPVEFTFVVTWGESYPTYEVTQIQELPPDTPLDFSGGMGG
jgi:hypothetical protein